MTSKMTRQLAEYVNLLEVATYRLLCKNLWLCPVLMALSIALMKVVYLVAFWEGHVAPLLPYTSDYGARSPEAAFFGLLVNLCAISLGITALIRSKQTHYYVNTKVASSASELIGPWRSITFLASSCAYLSTFLQITASTFRASEWFLTHFTLIGIGSILLTVYVSLTLVHCKDLARLQLESPPHSLTLITYLLLGAQALHLLLASVSFWQSDGHFLDADWRLHWSVHQNGYWAHVGAVIFDWIIMACYTLFALCLARRFKRFTDWEAILYGKER